MPAQVFNFSHPKKERLEHLLSLRGDLGRSDDALSSLLDRTSLFGGGGLLAEALFTVAVVAYVRCFASGRRKGLSAKIYSVRPRLMKAHEEFKSIRDQHIAHAVGLLENLQIMVAAQDANSPAQGVGSLGVFFSHTQQRPSLLSLRRVVRFARSHVDREIEEVGAEIASAVMGQKVTWKQSQRAFFAAIGSTGFAEGSSAIEARVSRRAPSVAGGGRRST